LSVVRLIVPRLLVMSGLSVSAGTHLFTMSFDEG